MKSTKGRKAFNFYKSYYDVYCRLSKADKIAFIDALLERQFNGTEPNLKGQAEFAYVSQKEVIDSQVKGWEDKTGNKLSTPTEGGLSTPCQQEKEKGEEKDKKNNIPTFEEFKSYALKKESSLVVKDLEFKYESWKENGWKDGNNNPIKNWKSKILNTIPYMKKDEVKREETYEEMIARKQSYNERLG